MRTTSFILLIGFSLIATTASGQIRDTLTNQKIVQLSELGLAPGAIITKIQSSAVDFDVSIEGLTVLKNQNVHSDVISEMITAQSKADAAETRKQDLNDPKTMRSKGIYYFNATDSAHRFTSVDATVVSNSQSGGAGTAIAQGLTYGLSKAKSKSTLSGTESHLQLKDSMPVFYFYFDSTAQSNTTAWWFMGASTPNEFALVKLKVTRTGREMTVGSANAYGQTSGIDEKQKIRFEYLQIAPRIYKVVPSTKLEKGEYCFVYTGSVPSIYANNKVFDFGVH